MNNRIKELAEQADKYAEETVNYYNGQFDGLTWESKIKQVRDTKFAEFIVRECEQVALKNSHRDDDMGAIIARQIKEHFGVENEQDTR